MATQWMTIKDLAEEIGVAPETLRQWRFRGNLGPPSYKMGAKVKYKRHEVAKWIESTKRETAQSLG